MNAPKPVPKKKKPCPQCGWDAEGTQLEETPEAVSGVTLRAPPPAETDYDCGNCGYRWVE